MKVRVSPFSYHATSPKNSQQLEHEMWKKYIIDNKKITYSKCEFEVEDVVSSPEETLLVLLSHYRSRRNHSRLV